MMAKTSYDANRLRHELAARNRAYARGRTHVESYGSAPVIVYAPEGQRHGNFFDAAYAAIAADADWMQRFNKVHAQATRSLPKAGRRWRELDSCTSSDALLMNIFCTPGVLASPAIRRALGLESDAEPVFGWKARVPLASGRFDRTEVDLRIGSLLIEAKLTEGDFQRCRAPAVEQYRDLDAVFDCPSLPRVEQLGTQRRAPQEFPENYSQEYESFTIDPELDPRKLFPEIAARIPAFNSNAAEAWKVGETCYAGYQLIRNTLAAHAEHYSFCVIHDERRPDLRKQWFDVMAAVKSAELRTRLKVLTWQELTAFLPETLQAFLDCKYGIVAPGRTASGVDEEAFRE
ncbi:MAG TPA: hypothetical protein VFW94_15460, partial [Candidatus Acidoferrales bacterium]|nr:hypothetical protein [Candidatus Acidoferrales bacterium]